MTEFRATQATVYLQDELQKKRLVVFLGAGCSAWAGLPLWSQMLDEIAKKKNIKTRQTEPLRLASRLESEMGKLPFREAVAEMLTPDPRSRTELHDALARMPVNLYITTNFDQLMEQALQKLGFPCHVVRNDEDLTSINRNKKTVVKLHGDIDSPSSLVITNADYQVYPSKHQGFIQWMQTRFNEETILFLGTSFDDLRLRDADAQVLRTFGDYRRPPVIVLREPEKPDTTEEEALEDYEIAKADFEALCDDFKGRNFKIHIIRKYEEILALIQSLKSSAESETQSSIFYTNEKVGEELKQLKNEKLRNILKKIKGEQDPPLPHTAWERAQELIEYISISKHSLSPESLILSYTTLAQAAMGVNELSSGREYYDKACDLTEKIPDKEPWKEDLRRISSRLLFMEGNSDEAIQEITEASDPATQSLWLSLLIEKNRISEAETFIRGTPLNKEWAPHAIIVLMDIGDVAKAEDTFRTAKTMVHDDKGELDRLESHYAMGLYRRVLRISGAEEGKLIVPYNVPAEAKTLCEQIIDISQQFRKRFPIESLKESIWFFKTIEAEMTARSILGQWRESIQCAIELIETKPLPYSAAHFLSIRIETLHTKDRDRLIDCLKKEKHQLWALLHLAYIQSIALEEHQEAWKTIEEAKRIARSKEGFALLAETAFTISVEMEDPKRGLDMARELLSEDNPELLNIKAKYETLTGDKEKAKALLKELMERDDIRDAHKADAHYISAQLAMQEDRYEEARKHIEEGMQIFPQPLAYDLYMRVLARMQDSAALYQCCKEMESLGIQNETSQFFFAQATFNLRLFAESERAWRELLEKKNNNIEYRSGLASALYYQRKVEEAIGVLEMYKDDKRCLNDLALILSNEDRQEELFILLNDGFEIIKDDPRLLLLYLDCAKRTGRENELGRALGELNRLKDEEKVPDALMQRYHKDDFIEIFTDMIQEKKKQIDEATEKYQYARFPRSLIAALQNISLYHDWAIRTQEIDLPHEPEKQLYFLTYCSDRIKTGNALKSAHPYEEIFACPDSDSITVDYHALITLHRLDMLEILKHYYTQIIIPASYRELWKTELKNYGFYQQSREKTWRELKKDIDSGIIKSAEAPELKEQNNEEPVKSDIRLVQLEHCPYLNNYHSAEDFNDIKDIVVLRLSQILDWLYETGRLAMNEWEQLKQITKGEPDVFHGDTRTLLKNTTHLIVDESTIEILYNHGIHKKLGNAGIKIAIESHTARLITHTLINIDFSEKVSKWHQKLIKYLDRNPKKFIFIPDEDNDSNSKHNPAIDTTLSAFRIAKKKNLPILTDDRATQNMAMAEGILSAFDTSALLDYFYKKGIIEIPTYTEKYLQLCRWRYRFLLPAPELLFYLAKQYHQNLPGAELNFVSRYAFDCMCDPGLNLSTLSTNPPLPLGVRYQLLWEKVVIDFLQMIWEDDNNIFDEASKKLLSEKVIHQMIPPFPKYLHEDVLKKLEADSARIVLEQVLLNAMESKLPEKLSYISKLLREDLQRQGKNPQMYLLPHIELVKKEEAFSEEEKDIIEERLYSAFFGNEERCFHGLALTYARELNIPLEIRKVDLSQSIDTALLTKMKSRGASPGKELVAGEERGPVLLIPPQVEEKVGKMFVPHEEVLNPSVKGRAGALERLLKDDKEHKRWITEPTRDKIVSLQSDLLLENPIIWEKTGLLLQEQLLKDCRYTRKLFFLALQCKDKGLVNKTWESVLLPSEETVWADRPLILKDNKNPDVVLREIKEHFNAQKGELFNTLDLYLDEIGFIPIGEPFDPWSILNGFLYKADKNNKSDEKFLDESGQNIVKWLKEQPYYEAYLTGINLLLTLRAEASRQAKEKSIEKSYFRSKEFYSALEDAMRAILVFQKDKPSEALAKEKLETRKRNYLWNLQLKLAEHYTMHLDSSAENIIPAEIKPLIAWHLSRRLCSEILRYWDSYSLELQVKNLEASIENISKFQRNLHFRYLFFDNAPLWSSTKFQTFFGMNPFIWALMAVLSPDYCHNTDDTPIPFTGTIRPAKALSGDVIDLIIDSIIDPISGIKEESLCNAKVLWSIPLGRSAALFLEKFYGTAYEFLGKENIERINFAKNLSDTKLQEQQLEEELKSGIKDGNGQKILILLGLLNSIVYTVNNEHPALLTLLGYNDLMKSLQNLKEKWATHSIDTLIRIYLRLRCAGKSSIADKIAVHLNKLEFKNFPDENASILALGIGLVALIGNDVVLIKMLVKESIINKAVRDTLGKFKSDIEKVFGDIPPSYRDRAKMIFNEMADIPSIDTRKEGDELDG